MNIPSILTEAGILDNLSRVNRAYNALYGAGLATPDSVPTLATDDVDFLLNVAAEVTRGEGDSMMHRHMRKLSPALLSYVAGGGL